jgi:hypothetical protein
MDFPLTHLWFLYYLSLFYVLALVLRAAFVTFVDKSGTLRTRIDAIVDAGIASYLAPFVRAIYTACYTASIWYWTFGLVGAAMRFCSTPGELRRYLADSSYWLYLCHLPIVFGLQAALMKVPLHWSIKFPLIVVITLTVLLVTYHYLVRSTFIGALLNGRKYESFVGL